MNTTAGIFKIKINYVFFLLQVQRVNDNAFYEKKKKRFYLKSKRLYSLRLQTLKRDISTKNSNKLRDVHEGWERNARQWELGKHHIEMFTPMSFTHTYTYGCGVHTF